MRLAVLQFTHETVTFLPNDTTRDDFVYPGSPATGAALLATDPKGYMGGFVQLAQEYDGVELVGITSPLWPRTGTASGWITADAYAHFLGRMAEELRARGPFDGVYLALHGAMAVRGVPRPEADIARQVRAAVGEGAILVGTFDLHGNEDAAFLDHADMAFAVKYFPHYDGHLQGQRAARMLVRAVRGEFRPAHRTFKVPILSPTVVQWTGAAPWSDLVQRALVWEAREPDVYVNVYFGFPWGDAPDAGMTVQAITNDDPALAERVARDVADFAWRRRRALLEATRIHTIADGVRLARAAVAEGAAPVVLADHSDRSGRATWLLREILRQGLTRTLVATVASPDIAAAETFAAGDPFDAPVGGGGDPSAGDPVRIAGTVLRVVEAPEPGVAGSGGGGTWICVAFGAGNVLVLSPQLAQIVEPDELWRLGLEPADFDIVAIKSRVHFRRGFDDGGYARTILLVEPPEPFLGTVRLDHLAYAHMRAADFFPYGDPPGPAPSGP
ncbi:M81 family metallopeptidase [Methylobacterium radiotolerans]|uniref:Microcystin LR degradation protein MlrC-like protein n=1 Tax=Methylobacterium radiotolerans (strain ATCC 27329 / DSM 1819 / JCM 2831 / NBRC 15690 / NCIMB 10815 / 0-1) TaxID=426355 RepID=B1M5L4_METRJ|nr:M81 family metallopeptidase [Methylobacterium radiotolerans]ACB25044.1 Microcystin LR degradation protein MlrC-like protein [Methylobacterium radiotolerans JCM 2831]GEM96305.1 microcystinase C [Methylobacterium radiotolerans]